MASGTVTIATAPGLELSVTVAGDGPMVILTHGWPELGFSWRHQVEALAAAGYRVAAPDMPAGFRCGEKQIVLAFGGNPLDQQERPEQVNAALIGFLDSFSGRPG